jgi:hypothetical protein
MFRVCRLAALAGIAALGASCAPVVLLNVQLELADPSLKGQATALKVVVRDVGGGRQPQVFTIDLANNEARLETALPPGSTYYVDVFGCRDVCEAEGVVLRGCSLVRTVPAENQENFTVRLFDDDSAEASECPPPGA